MKRILVTGAQGFVGRHLMRGLGNEHTMVGVDLADGLDLADFASFERIEGDFDCVIHLAARSFVPDSFAHPLAFYHTNVLGALHVAEFCRLRRVPCLIYPNTYVYGNPQHLPVSEQHPIALPSPYHRSKMLAEELLRGYFPPEGTRVISLRVFNLYGPGQDSRFLVSQLIQQARMYSFVTVKDATPRRDFLYIRDFAELVAKIVATRDPPAGVYNIGTGQSHSVAELVTTLSQVLNKPLRLDDARTPRPGEIVDCYADTTRAREAFGWSPKYALADGLRETLSGEMYV
jgi:nucleoside-diphosphate-sugar epimerase